MKKIILSRTDNLGDVILTLPMCGLIKSFDPSIQIYFLGKGYTKPIIERCIHVDYFLNWDDIVAKKNPEEQAQVLSETGAEMIILVSPVKAVCSLAKKAGIPLRVATVRKWLTWSDCNRLLNIPRKNSSLHEAQLNLKLLKPLGINRILSLTEIPSFYGLTPDRTSHISDPDSRFNLILHPRSKGSAREWGLDNFSRLIDLLPPDRFRIFVTGTKEEGLSMSAFLEKYRERITDLTGTLTVDELISFIGNCNGLVAASTGPLHIAAALGLRTIGLFAPMHPIHPGRWAPLGTDAHFLVIEKKCSDCRKTGDCHCIRSITPESVFRLLIAS